MRGDELGASLAAARSLSGRGAGLPRAGLGADAGQPLGDGRGAGLAATYGHAGPGAAVHTPAPASQPADGSDSLLSSSSSSLQVSRQVKKYISRKLEESVQRSVKKIQSARPASEGLHQSDVEALAEGVVSQLCPRLDKLATKSHVTAEAMVRAARPRPRVSAIAAHGARTDHATHILSRPTQATRENTDANAAETRRQANTNAAMLAQRLVELKQQGKQADEQSQRRNAEQEMANATQAMQQHAMMQNIQARQQQAYEKLQTMDEARERNEEAQSIRAELTTVSNLNLAAQVTTVSAQVTALHDQGRARSVDQAQQHAEAMEKLDGTQARRISAYS